MTTEIDGASDERDDSELSLTTLAIRTGQLRTDEGAHAEPIFATSSFVFESAEAAAARFSGDQPGNIYSRFTNPTVRSFEQRLAALEGGERAVATASGMSAIFATFLAFLQSGDHVVSSRSIFGTTHVMYEKYLKKFGVETTLVDLTSLAAWQQAITPKTKIFFLETPSNPLCEIGDISALASLAKAHDILLVVDNCYCTPVLQQPLALGADIVIHSATKFLDGQGRSVGGAVVGSAKLMEEVHGVLRTCGPTMSPFNAWIALKGLETLAVRMHAHCNNAEVLAAWLEAHEGVTQVYYVGLESHPQKAIAAQQQSRFGGVLSFVVAGGREAAWKVINQTKIMSISANLGDVKTIITHPATTTHGRLSAEAKEAAGIVEGLIRISVGLEDVEDLKRDLARGLP